MTATRKYYDVQVDFTRVDPEAKILAYPGRFYTPVLGDWVVLGSREGHRCNAQVSSIDRRGRVEFELDITSFKNPEDLLDSVLDTVA